MRILTVVVVLGPLVAAWCGWQPPTTAPAQRAPIAAPTVETAPAEHEPAAWRCVREGRCAVPRETDGGVLR
jgi:hypothetical protein